MKSNRGFRSMWEWMKERPTTVEEPDEHLESPQDLLSSKQIEKLKLEIENLRNKYKRIETFSPLFPLVATLVTMIALVLGFWQFQRQQRYLQEKTMSEQRYERTTRLQNQLRVDMDEIIGFTEDKSQTFSRAEFILTT